MEGRTDREVFKARVPIVTYEDLRPEIERTANSDRSNIISSHPITEFLTRYHVLLLRESQVGGGGRGA
uniref:Uncharacterized protein n=1 Tax=Oryza rufipogon TaxID=4529 RepID=A0A0E0PND6_ORYRU